MYSQYSTVVILETSAQAQLHLQPGTAGKLSAGFQSIAVAVPGLCRAAFIWVRSAGSEPLFLLKFSHLHSISCILQHFSNTCSTHTPHRYMNSTVVSPVSTYCVLERNFVRYSCFVSTLFCSISFSCLYF